MQKCHKDFGSGNAKVVTIASLPQQSESRSLSRDSGSATNRWGEERSALTLNDH